MNVGKVSEFVMFNDLVEYKSVLKLTTMEYKVPKSQFEKLLTVNQSFYAYKYRSKAKTKDMLGPLNDENGRWITACTEETEMCDTLNKFF